MSPALLRRLWKIIDESPSETLLQLSESDLAKQLLMKIQGYQPLTRDEQELVRRYIRSHAPLIHDLVRSQRSWMIQPLGNRPVSI